MWALCFLNDDRYVLCSAPSVLKQFEINRARSKSGIDHGNLFFGKLFRDDRVSGVIAVDNEKIEEENWKGIL